MSGALQHRYCWQHPDPNQKTCDAPEEYIARVEKPKPGRGAGRSAAPAAGGRGTGGAGRWGKREASVEASMPTGAGRGGRGRGRGRGRGTGGGRGAGSQASGGVDGAGASACINGSCTMFISSWAWQCHSCALNVCARQRAHVVARAPLPFCQVHRIAMHGLCASQGCHLDAARLGCLQR